MNHKPQSLATLGSLCSMRKLKLHAVAAALALLFFLPLPGHAAQPQRGDHVDLTLDDGRTFKNAEVIKSDEDSVLIRSGSSLTSFKPHEIRAINLTGTTPAAPVPTVAPQPSVESVPTPAPAQQPSASSPPATHASEHDPGELPKHEPTQVPASAVPLLVLSVCLLAAIIYVHWQRRTNRKLNVEAKRLEAFTNELKTKLAGLEGRYSGLIAIDKVMDERKREIETVSHDIRQHNVEREQVTAEIAELRKQLSMFEEEGNIVACGHYHPTFDFNTSEEFKQAIDLIRESQRDLLKNEEAAHCSQRLTLNGSEEEGRKATKRTLRLMLRAFNGESDAIIARVSWNNIDRMVERLEAVFQAINKLGESYSCALTREYMMMKQQELKLTFEYENKLKKEKDEQRELKEQMRDEERARREMEEALRQTALDEERAKKALEQAREELGKATGEKEALLNEKIKLLESRLQEALQNKERAISRAQQTRSGHVYIISNIGSFGETVFKIGMTRRLEPYDRVHELGDASVPFAFDVHAMIFTDDAPTLESKLHQRFERNRVNLVNERKEFFIATIDELEAAVKEMGATIQLTRLAEAREFRETLERRKVMKVGKVTAGATV
jgi:hypothetical protein